MDNYVLALLLRDIGNFDMSSFRGRLLFQKTIQLLQSFGIDCGYRYNWYLRGPYSPDLAKVGYELKDIMPKLPDIPIEFEDEADRVRYDRFRAFIHDKKDRPDALEIASSICFLRNEEGLGKEMVLRLTKGKRSHFTMDGCQRLWDELETYEVVEG